MHQYKNLVVWQKAVDITVEIYKLSASFPKEEMFGMVSQIRRSSSSVAFNIAEGAGRGSKKEFNYFLDVALGSICELETQLIVSEKLSYLKEPVLNNLSAKIEEIQKMILGLKKANTNVTNK